MADNIQSSTHELIPLLRSLVEQLTRTAVAQEENIKLNRAQTEALAKRRPPQIDFGERMKDSREQLKESMQKTREFQEEQRKFWAALLAALERHSVAIERNNELLVEVMQKDRS